MLDAFVARKDFGEIPRLSQKTVDIVNKQTQVQLSVCSDLGKKIFLTSQSRIEKPRKDLKEAITSIEDRLRLTEGESCCNKTLLLLGTIAAVIFVAGVIILGALGGVSPPLLAAFGTLSVLGTNLAAGGLTFQADLEYELINRNDLNQLGILFYGIISAFASVFTRVSRLQSQIDEKKAEYNRLNKEVADSQDQIQQYLDKLKDFIKSDNYRIVAQYLEIKRQAYSADLSSKGVYCYVSAETYDCMDAQRELERVVSYFQKQKVDESPEKKV